MPGRLIVCSTPIGNLGDVSARVADALASADLIYAEDTRRTATLTRHLGVTTPLRSYFAGNERQRSVELIDKLRSGQVVTLVTDAGTPSISDPGVSAVRAAISAEAEVSVVPGPSAVTASLAVSGMSGDRFVFDGFLPKKGSAREARLSALATEERTIVLYSATNQVHQDLADLAQACGDDRDVVVCRELTKVHEEVLRTTLSEAAKHRATTAPRGEFTLVVAGVPKTAGNLDDALDDVRTRIASGESLSTAVRNASQQHGVSRRQLYEAAIETRSDGEHAKG